VLTHAHEDHSAPIIDLWPKSCNPYLRERDQVHSAALVRGPNRRQRNAPKIPVTWAVVRRIDLGPFNFECHPGRAFDILTRMRWAIHTKVGTVPAYRRLEDRPDGRRSSDAARQLRLRELV